MIDNIEELVDRLVMREAEAIIEENKQMAATKVDSKPAPPTTTNSSGKKKMAKFRFGNDDDLEEIEDIPALNTSGEAGFQLFNK